MRTITTSTITATLFDADPYLFERNVVKFKTTKSTMYLRIGSSHIAVYYNVANKEMLIDLTEYIIANPTPTSAITLYDTSTIVTITWKSSGKLFNPNKIQRPSYPLAQFFTKKNLRVNYPNVIFAPSSIFSGDHFLAWSPVDDLDFSLQSSGGDTIGSDVYIVETAEEDTFISIGLIDSKAQYNMQMRQQKDCIQYIDIKWECLFKKDFYKKHKFELYEQSESVDVSQELYNYKDGGLALTEKSRKKTITLKLDDLSTYDLWYYSDLLTSSNVFAYVDGEWQRIQVITKNINIPFNSVKRNELMIDVLIEKGFNL